MARPEQLQSNEKTAEYVSAGDRLRRFFFFVLKAQSLLYSKKILDKDEACVLEENGC